MNSMDGTMGVYNLYSMEGPKVEYIMEGTSERLKRVGIKDRQNSIEKSQLEKLMKDYRKVSEPKVKKVNATSTIEVSVFKAACMSMSIQQICVKNI